MTRRSGRSIGEDAEDTPRPDTSTSPDIRRLADSSTAARHARLALTTGCRLPSPPAPAGDRECDKHRPPRLLIRDRGTAVLLGDHLRLGRRPPEPVADHLRP